MNEIMSNDTTFSWGWVIFLILILWFFVGGNGFGFGYGNRAGSFLAGDVLGQIQGRDASLSCGASNCEVERRSLITAADTNFRIIDQAQQTRSVVEATSATTNAKIDFYCIRIL